MNPKCAAEGHELREIEVRGTRWIARCARRGCDYYTQAPTLRALIAPPAHKAVLGPEMVKHGRDRHIPT